MRKVWLVVKREYLTRVRTKGFILGTIAVPLFTVATLAVPLFMATRAADRALTVVILDRAGGFAANVTAALQEKPPGARAAFRVVRTVEKPQAGELEKLRAELRRQVSQEELDGFLVIPEDLLEGKTAAFHTRNPTDFNAARVLRQAMTEAVIARRLTDRGFRADNVNELVKGADITLLKVTKEGEIEERGQTFAVAMVMMTVLYMTLLVYGLATLRSVLEEKTTRTVEVLVSSLRAIHLLVGKLIGVAAVGFTQYLIWTLTSGLVLTYGATVAAAFFPSASMPRLHVPASLLVYLVIFYLAGYFLYAALYAAAGAMVSSDEEAQQVQLPMTLLIVAAFMLFTAVLRNPNSTLSVVLSLIPFFAPIIMVLRITLQTPPFWQIALSIALMILTTYGTIRLSAKIYRVGILMYGKRPSVVELLRWLRYT